MNKVSYSTRSALLLALLGAGTVFVACGDGAGLIYPPDAGDTTATTSGGGGEGSTTATTDVSSSASGTGGSSTGTGGAPPATLSWVTELDAAKGEIPEGLVINAAGDTAYLGYAVTGQIVKVALADGKVTAFGNVPPPPAGNKGFVLGLALSTAGDVYVGVASFDAAYKPGVYKIPAAGGPATLFSSDAAMTFPNGLTFDATGNLFVTNSLTGSIFKIDAAGVATKWTTDALITGDVAAACSSGLGFPLGANGIILSKGAFYVTNTDKASIVKIPVMADGTAGAATSFAATDCANMGGADGLSEDADGTFLVASNGINAITRVATDGKLTIVVEKDKLESPASTWISNKTLFVTNSSFQNALGGKPAKPGLLKLPLGG
jgi:sugar lactone lactonase YvrE